MLKFSEKGGWVDIKQNYLLELFSLSEEVSFILDFHIFFFIFLIAFWYLTNIYAQLLLNLLHSELTFWDLQKEFVFGRASDY